MIRMKEKKQSYTHSQLWKNQTKKTKIIIAGRQKMKAQYWMILAINQKELSKIHWLFQCLVICNNWMKPSNLWWRQVKTRFYMEDACNQPYYVKCVEKRDKTLTSRDTLRQIMWRECPSLASFVTKYSGPEMVCINMFQNGININIININVKYHRTKNALRHHNRRVHL